jgi:hypothetical protein
MWRIPNWARVVFIGESVATVIGAWFVAAPNQQAEARGAEALLALTAIIVVSVCVGVAAARRNLARRLLVMNSASVPILGLFMGWVRGTEHAATWYGYVVVWSVMAFISLLASVIGYGIGRAASTPTLCPPS